MPDIIVFVITNPLWAKVLAALVLLVYLHKIGTKSGIPVLGDFQGIAILLLVTDGLLVFLPLLPALAVLPVLQGFGVLFFYQRILKTYTAERSASIGFWVLGIPSCAIAAVSPYLGSPWYLSVAPPFALVVCWIGFSRRLYGISEFNTEGAGVIQASRRSLSATMIVLHALALILSLWNGYLNLFVQMMVFPLANLVHAWVLSFWERFSDAEKTRQTTTIEKNLASLFDFMVAIGNAISEKLEMDKVLAFVVRSAVKATNADGGAVFLVDEFEDQLLVKAIEGDFPPPYQVPPKVKLKSSNLTEYFHATPIPLNKTIVGECAMTRKGIFIRDSRSDERMDQNTQLDQLYISSIILTPLMQGNKVFGVLAVVSRRGNYLFSAEHYSQIQTFADYTSLTINNLFTYRQLLEKQEMEREVGIAAEIQGQLLPSKLPVVSSVSLAAYSAPAKGVSGDYYDVINIRKGQILLAVCDVAGKGIPASLVMVMIRTIIHLVAHQPGMSVGRILDVVNWGIAGRVSLDRFATLALLSYDFVQHQLQYSNAAHHPLLIFRTATRSFETLDTEGIPIGLEKKTKYNEVNTVLHPADIVVLYTDGIIEAMNDRGDQYSLDSLQRVILSHCELTPEKLKRAIIDDMNGFVGKAKQHDDQTFLLMKVDG